MGRAVWNILKLESANVKTEQEEVGGKRYHKKNER